MTPAYYAALCELSDDLCHAFAEVDTFAAARPEGAEWQTRGRWFKRSGGKTLRIKGPSSGGGEAKPRQPAGPAKPGPLDPGNPGFDARAQAAKAVGWNGKGIPPGLAQTQPKPAAPPAAKPPDAAPAPPPAATQVLDAAKAEDTKKYGGTAASILHRTGVVLLRFFLKGLGAVGGGAIGAAAGFGLSGGNPLGAIAGGLAGGVLGGNALTAPRNLTAPRMRALARKTARAVVPAAAGTAVGLGGAIPTLGLQAATAVASPVAGAATAPVAVAGTLGAAKVGQHVAQSVRERMATSAVSRRKAERFRRKQGAFSPSTPFSEFAEALPPDAVQLLKARVIAAAKAAGVELGDVPDEVIAEALAMAQQDAGAAVMSECFREARKAARNLTQLARV
jgi:hypothetical protein